MPEVCVFCGKSALVDTYGNVKCPSGHLYHRCKAHPCTIITAHRASLADNCTCHTDLTYAVTPVRVMNTSNRFTYVLDKAQQLREDLRKVDAEMNAVKHQFDQLSAQLMRANRIVAIMEGAEDLRGSYDVNTIADLYRVARLLIEARDTKQREYEEHGKRREEILTKLKEAKLCRK